MSGYMFGVTKKGIDLVSKITGLLNELTADDFEGTYVALRVSLVEEDLSREVGFWSNEYDFGNWAFFDGARSDIEATGSMVTLDDIETAIWNESSNLKDGHLSRSGAKTLALGVMATLKEKKLL